MIKYYIDNIGDLWKVDHDTNTFYTCESTYEDIHFVKANHDFLDDYIIIHELKEIPEDRVDEIIEGNKFIYEI